MRPYFWTMLRVKKKKKYWRYGAKNFPICIRLLGLARRAAQFYSIAFRHKAPPGPEISPTFYFATSLKVMPDPDLSIVIPCFDEGPYLIEAVQSVLQQEATQGNRLPTFEIIIVNDKTRDKETLAALKQLSQLDARIRILLNSGRPGPGAARNAGIKAAKGEWIAFLDGDDRWVKNAIDVRWAVLREHPKAAWVSADFRYFYVSGEGGGEYFEDPFFRSRPVPSEMLSEAFGNQRVLKLEKPVAQFLKCSLAWTGTVMAKRSLLIRLDSFD